MKRRNLVKTPFFLESVFFLLMVLMMVFSSCKKNVCKSDLPVPVIQAVGASAFCEGGSVQLKASVPEGDYDYHWELNGQEISGANGAAYLASKEGSYQAVINEKDCSTKKWSAPFLVKVNSNFEAIVNSSSTDLCNGSAILYGKACPDFQYQWKKNNEIIQGATSNSITVTTPGDYQLQITKGSENAWSSIVTITPCAAK